MRAKRGTTAVLAMAAGMMLLAGTALADFTPPGLLIRANDHSQGNGPPDWVNPGNGNRPDPNNRPDLWQFSGRIDGPGNKWFVEYEIEADPDPYLAATFTINNVGNSSAQDFTLSSLLPISPALGAPTLTGGSFSGTLIDMNGDGAWLDEISTGEDMYMSQIDGNDYVPLNLSVPIAAPAGETAGFGPANFGTPIPSLYGPAANDDIGVITNVRISPGDIATLVATFVVEVPEPASAALVALGAVGLLLRRKRRS